MYVNKLNSTCQDITGRIDDIWYTIRKVLKIKDMSINEYMYFPGYLLNISMPRNAYEDSINCGDRTVKLRKSNDLMLFITESILTSFEHIIDGNNLRIIKNNITSKFHIKRNTKSSLVADSTKKINKKRKVNQLSTNEEKAMQPHSNSFKQTKMTCIAF